MIEALEIVGLSNRDENIKGFMTIGFTKSSIIQIASAILGEQLETMNAEVRKAVAEIATTISGQARQRISLLSTKGEASLQLLFQEKILS